MQAPAPAQTRVLVLALGLVLVVVPTVELGLMRRTPLPISEELRQVVLPSYHHSDGMRAALAVGKRSAASVEAAASPFERAVTASVEVAARPMQGRGAGAGGVEAVVVLAGTGGHRAASDAVAHSMAHTARAVEVHNTEDKTDSVAGAADNTDWIQIPRVAEMSPRIGQMHLWVVALPLRLVSFVWLIWTNWHQCMALQRFALVVGQTAAAAEQRIAVAAEQAVWVQRQVEWKQHPPLPILGRW